MLLQALARLDPRWRLSHSENTITLHKSTLGEPYLLLGDQPGPSLSFSHGKERLWAAMSSKGRVGIDVAYPEDFAADYPFARAFRPEELDSVRAICHNDTARGAALIWSAKEASVKATGTGFNRFDPLDVQVGAPLFREQGVGFEVLADQPITAWVRTEGKGWLCVALA
jgi:phosphopantetheinyl transferase